MKNNWIFLVLFLAIAFLITFFVDNSPEVESLTVLILALTLFFQVVQYSSNSFESRFFEMIRLHRQNVSEFEINDNIKEKKVFMAMMFELRAARNIVLEVCYTKPLISEMKHDLLSISYLILFFGVGENSNRMLEKLLQNYMPKETALKLLKRLKEDRETACKEIGKYEYKYFDGHQLRLGHYYRHLFQTIDYLNTSKATFLSNKKQYAKLLRAQLSTYEQALFFINSISPLGLNWWRKGYIGNYGLVKNIPSDFFKKNEIDLKSYFPKSGSYSINKKCDHNDVYFEFETYKIDDYEFLNGCVTKMGNNKQDELNSK